MSPEQMAAMIPAVLRKEILAMNMIEEAVPDMSKIAMRTLFHAWYSCVDPHAYRDETCNLCLGKVIENFKWMKPALISLENMSLKLNQLV